MNLKELKRTIDFTISTLHKYESPEDIPVLITLSEPSVGSRASSGVIYVGTGIDWEHGQLRIEPQQKLVRKGNAKTDVIPSYEHTPYGGGRKMYPLKYAVKKNYRYSDNVNCWGEYEQVLHNYEASICFLVKEYKVYHEVDNPKFKYEVSFPREDNISRKIIFEVDKDIWGEPYNTSIVTKIFDSNEDAELEAKRLNNERYNNYI